MGARGNQGLPPPAVQGSGGPPAKYCLEVVAVVWEPPCVAWGPAARPCCGAPRSRSPVGGRPVGQGPRLSGAAGSPGRGHLLAALPQACGLWRRRAPGPLAHWGEAVNLLRSAGPGAAVALGQVCVGGQTLPRWGPSLGPRLPSRPTPGAGACARVWTESCTGSGWRPWPRPCGPRGRVSRGRDPPSQDEDLPEDAALRPGRWKRGSGGSESGRVSGSRGLVGLDRTPFVGPTGHFLRVPGLFLLCLPQGASPCDEGPWASPSPHLSQPLLPGPLSSGPGCPLGQPHEPQTRPQAWPGQRLPPRRGPSTLVCTWRLVAGSASSPVLMPTLCLPGPPSLPWDGWPPACPPVRPHPWACRLLPSRCSSQQAWRGHPCVLPPAHLDGPSGSGEEDPPPCPRGLCLVSPPSGTCSLAPEASVSVCLPLAVQPRCCPACWPPWAPRLWLSPSRANGDLSTVYQAAQRLPAHLLTAGCSLQTPEPKRLPPAPPWACGASRTP